MIFESINEAAHRHRLTQSKALMVAFAIDRGHAAETADALAEWVEKNKGRAGQITSNPYRFLEIEGRALVERSGS
jgi:type II secretory pathway component PulK